MEINIYTCASWGIVGISTVSLLLYYMLLNPIKKMRKDIQKRIKELTGKSLEVSGTEISKLKSAFRKLFEINKEHTDKIKDSERRVASMIDAIDIGLMEVDGRTHKILNINQYGASLVGLEKHEIINKKSCYEIACIHTTADNCSMLHIEDLVSIRRECTIKNRKTGKLTPIIKTAVKIPINYHSNIIESFVDITDRKKHEEELAEAKARANTADEGKTNLLRKVCHDIGNRMSEGVGLAHMIMKIKDLPEEVYTKINKIVDSLRVMDNSLKLMRDRTMLETGLSKIRLDVLDLKEFVRVHVNSFVSGIEDKGLKFNLELPDDFYVNKKLLVVTDEAKLDAIIVNLILNAKKFTNKGTITWRIEYITPPNHISRGIRFSIIDTGIGIAKEEQEKIFEVYEQANEQIQKEFGGSGQGLAIVRKYVKMLGGEIRVSSKLGEGSSFSFDIDFKIPEDVQGDVDMDISDKNLNNTRVLAVDDSETMRDILEDVLGDIGVKFKVVESGERALDLLEREFYHFVFLDIQMEGISGIQTTEELRKHFNIPVIALTANVSDIDIDTYKQHGIDDCIGKPFDIVRIRGIIAKYRDRSIVNVEKVNSQYKVGLYNTIIKSFKKEFTCNIQDMQLIIEKDKINEVDILKFETCAHTIKGIAATVYADYVRHAAYLLEKLGKSRKLHRGEDKEVAKELMSQMLDEYNDFVSNDFVSHVRDIT